MYQEMELCKKFFEFLIKKGYPQESIDYRFPLAAGKQADIAILNPSTKQLLALVEVKYAKPTAKQKAALIEQFHFYLKTGIIVFLLYPSTNFPGFNLEYLDAAQPIFQTCEVDLFPSFTILCNKYVILKHNSVQQENELFERLICWWMVVSVVLFLSELYQWLPPLSPTQLILLGVSMGLSFFPVLRRIKILGIELERLVPPNK